MNSNGDLSEFDLLDSSSSDDSGIEDLLHDLEDDNEATLLLLAVKELEDRARLNDVASASSGIAPSAMPRS
jgi:hypothetical protein